MTTYVAFTFIIGVAVVIFLAGHLLVYLLLAHFLQLYSLDAKLTLVALLLFFGVSFIISTALAHYSENWFTKGYYFVAGIWLGVAVKLLFFLSAAWLIELVIKSLGYSSNLPILGVAAILISVVYAGYGIWNAYHPVITEISVNIKGLPAQWQGKRVIQISDVHLGHILNQKFFEAAIARVNNLKPEAIFITGDLYDGMDGHLDWVGGELNKLTAPQGIYFITGNHETYYGVDKVVQALAATKVKFLRDEKVDLGGLQLIGIDYPERGYGKNIADTILRINGYNRDAPSILLYHDPVQIEAIKKAGIKLQLSGHTHAGQIFPLDIITWLIYGKYYTGLHTEGDYTLYTTTGLGSWGPTMRTPYKPEIVVITLN